MIGQLSICFKYDFIPESNVLFTVISDELKALNGQITDQDIDRLRGIYEVYLNHLVEFSWFLPTTMPLFPVQFTHFSIHFSSLTIKVSLNMSSWTSVAAWILDWKNPIIHFIIVKLNTFWVEVIANNESFIWTLFIRLKQKSGGKILNGLFVVEPGVLCFDWNFPVTGWLGHKHPLSGISIETSLEFIAHREIKVARLTSSKTLEGHEFAAFEINNYDKTKWNWSPKEPWNLCWVGYFWINFRECQFDASCF